MTSPLRVAPAWTLGILAGGRSRRMGRDKASLEIGGLTLLEHIANRLAAPGVPVLIATRPDGPGRDGSFPWVPDVLPGEGPLSGMAALLKAATTPFVLAVPIDAPLLPSNLGDRLLGHAPSMEAVLMSAGDRTVPLPALLSREILPRILRLLESGERRALAYLDRAPCAVVPFSRLFPGLDPEEVLLNVNTPADLERALALLSRTSER